MKLDVEHQDSVGSIHNLTFDLSLPEFILNMSYVGLGSRHSSLKNSRVQSNMYKFAQYWNNNKFKFPKIIMSDPTALGQLSNEIGLALANYLATKIYNSNYSINYEYLMREQGYSLHHVPRPDLYCIDKTMKQQFAIEVKGSNASSVSNRWISAVKSEASTGPLKTHFNVASIAYNLYSSPKVKFHDPTDSNFPFDNELYIEIRQLHYKMILDFLSQRKRQKYDETYFKYLLPPSLDDNARNPLTISFIIHKSIIEGDYNQLDSLDSIYKKDLYINKDGIGILIDRKENNYIDLEEY